MTIHLPWRVHPCAESWGVLKLVKTGKALVAKKKQACSSQSDQPEVRKATWMVVWEVLVWYCSEFSMPGRKSWVWEASRFRRHFSSGSGLQKNKALLCKMIMCACMSMYHHLQMQSSTALKSLDKRYVTQGIKLRRHSCFSPAIKALLDKTPLCS